MKPELFQLWVYLSASPLFGLTATMLAYCAGLWVARRANLHPLANPVAIAVLLLVGVFSVSGVQYAQYFEGAQFVHFLLGPATVALAVPLFAQLPALRRHRWKLLLALACGGLASALSAVGVAWLLGASQETMLSLLPKSVTAPIAMGIAEQIGGNPALTAVYCVTTGIVGAALGRYVFGVFGVRSALARGFALGTAAHGIGTARAFQESEEAGAFAGLAMGLHGLLAALAVPTAVAFFRSL
ncbi:MAG: hypothetical protein ABS55_06785 [Lautropia sp. SCN 70-15]|nr:MAG: hypothetical protein ABS55_06785 [Lautropia sp. SCN 70-15]